MKYPNPLKQRIRDGELLLGTVLPAHDSFTASVVCRSDVDFLWIDTEHSASAVEDLDMVPVIARQRDVAPMIRVAWNDPALVKKAYDIGAVAVMIPQVNTAEEAERAVQYARYAPEGNRGISPYWAMLAGLDFNHVVRTANEETVLVLQIESLEAYENLDEIMQVDGIDVLFVGPTDLSATLGVITQTDSREVQSIMRDVPKRLDGSGIMAGTTLDGMEEIREKIDWGYRYINVGSPMGYGMRVLQDNLDALRNG
ncbi:MAG: aldolase/citrate lyase family protein [Gemmatimonadetes bacterium]|nr:aldolase/citrate lyase family protein [Gemmatimonadota bacterium]